MTSRIANLIRDLERVDGPQTMLDEEIAVAVGAAKWDGPTRMFTEPEAPAYTASIDAALTLVPEGWRGKLIVGDWPSDIPQEQDRAALWSNDHERRESWFGLGGDAATPALALTIAALKAREADDAD